MSSSMGATPDPDPDGDGHPPRPGADGAGLHGDDSVSGTRAPEREGPHSADDHVPLTESAEHYAADAHVPLEETAEHYSPASARLEPHGPL